MRPIDVFRARGAAGGTPTWTPASLSVPPKLWINDASAITDAGGGACSQWNDISANGWNFTQGTNRPTIIASGLNGRRTVRFNGINNRMATSSAGAKGIMQNVGAGWALFVVKKMATDGAGADRHMLMVSNNATGTTRFIASQGISSAANKPNMYVRRNDGDSTTPLTSGTAISTSWHMHLLMMDWANADGFIHKDGQADVQNLSLLTAGSTSNTPSADFPSLGSASNGAGGFADMDLAEMIVGAGALPSAGEVDQLFGYVAHRWGLTGSLPGGHPYKITPP